jgi:hypothetical protein
VKIPTGWVRIVNRATGLAIGIKDGSLAAGALADQRGGRWPSHHWQIERTPRDFYYIRNQKSGQFLAITDRSTDRGASACQLPDKGRPAILWKFEAVSEGCWCIRNRNSDQCLEPSGSDNGAVIRQTPYRANAIIQQWQLEEVKLGK